MLIAEDQLLASALIDLLEACYELETLSPSNASLPVDSLPLTASSSSVVDTPTSHAALAQQHLSDLLIAAQSHTVATACRIPSTTQLHAASNVVSEELVWARIETLTRAVLDLVRERTERISLLEAKEIHTRADEIAFEDSRNNPFTSPFDCAHESDTQLPRYSQNVHFDDLVDRASLPSYDDHTYPYNSHRIIDKKEDTASLVDETSSIPISSRKMSPSFNMLTEMNASSSKSRSDKEDKMRQLEEIWEGIERAHGSKRFGEHPRRSSLRDGADVISMKVSVFLMMAFKFQLSQHDQLTRALPDQADTTGSRDENSASRLIEADLVSTQELGEVSGLKRFL